MIFNPFNAVIKKMKLFIMKCWRKKCKRLNGENQDHRNFFSNA